MEGLGFGVEGLVGRLLYVYRFGFIRPSCFGVCVCVRVCVLAFSVLLLGFRV